ncbi:P-type conjugative transfer ATPase TrbB [Nitratireductor aquibiodomus RA22]|uniref:P-type conjugative transfer ATPase TrbB n=1 Tax=Nitratireductor aquibiodomus RA22 TaxID=1189611 RepID=I5BRP3_9HYPH|nr:P-type conjugative transfer ATPase TrbB [Nitratireductor aquibiodomus RA22]
MLRTALGPAIATFLEDPGVLEVMLNPDGRLWIDRLSEGLSDTGEHLSSEDGERIIRLVAHHVGAEVHTASPRVSAELPGTGERFEGLLPPIVAAPAFAIRKPAVAVFTLDDYVAAGIMTAEQASAAGRRRSARQHPRRRRHLHRQDDADQRSSGRGRENRRPRRHHRGHARAAVCRTQPRRHADEGRRRLALRSRPFVASPAARPHSHR